jgi:hypothetical protein
MSEFERGWLECLRFTLSSGLPCWRAEVSGDTGEWTAVGPWRLRESDASDDLERRATGDVLRRIVTSHVGFDEIVAFDHERMAVQCRDDVDQPPDPPPVEDNGAILVVCDAVELLTDICDSIILPLRLCDKIADVKAEAVNWLSRAYHMIDDARPVA